MSDSTELPSVSLQPTIKVLLIDDDELQHLIIEKFLNEITNTKYDLTCVSNYEAAMEQIDKNTADYHPYDVYLVDYDLGSHKGTTIIQEAIEKGCEAPMIIQTSNTEHDTDVRAMDVGAVDYLVKSQIGPSLLERSIRYAIKQKETEIQLSMQNQIIVKHVEEAERMNHYLIQLTQRITLELEQARKTQLAMLPQDIPSLPGCQIATKYEPMEQIGGDFYDLFDFSNDRMGILLADVTGHGIPAALISFMVSSLFKTIAPRTQNVESTIRQVNNALHNKIPEDKFATIFYCTYDAKTKILNYVSMGHPPGYVMRASSHEIIPLQTKGILLGVFPIEKGQFEGGSIQLLPGDKIFLYTDGLVEMANKQKELFGPTRLQSLLKEQCHLPIEEIIENVYMHVLNFSEATDYNDDITLVGIELDAEE